MVGPEYIGEYIVLQGPAVPAAGAEWGLSVYYFFFRFFFFL